MNRFIGSCLAAAILLFSCAGCGSGSGGSAPPPVSAESAAEAARASFQAAATIRMGPVTAQADFNKTAQGVYTFSFSEPAALKGMTVTLDGERISFSYLGLSFSADSGEVLQSAATKAVVAAVNRAGEPNGITVGTTDSGITVTGQTEEGTFTLLLDPRDQSLLTLSIPALDLECSFSAPVE